MVTNGYLVAARVLWTDGPFIEVSLSRTLQGFLEGNLGARDLRFGRKCWHGPHSRSDLSHILQIWIHYF